MPPPIGGDANVWTAVVMAFWTLVQLAQLVQTVLTRRDVRRSLRPPRAPKTHYAFPQSIDPPRRRRRDTPRERPVHHHEPSEPPEDDQ